MRIPIVRVGGFFALFWPSMYTMSSCVAGNAGDAGDDDDARFELQEVRVLSLSDLTHLRGVVSSDAATVVWGDAEAVSIDWETQAVAELNVSDPQRPVGAWIAGDTIEVYDGRGERIGRFGRGGGRRSVRESGLRGPALAAVKAPCGWVALTSDPVGQGRLQYVDQWNLNDGSKAIVGEVLGGGPASSIRLSALPDGFAVGRVGEPFTTAVIRCDGRGLRLDDPEGEREGWTNISTVEVGEWFLQTRAELVRDQREFVVFSKDGRVVRRVEVAFPIALHGTVNDSTVVAGRYVGEPEIVLYRVRPLETVDPIR